METEDGREKKAFQLLKGTKQAMTELRMYLDGALKEILGYSLSMLFLQRIGIVVSKKLNILCI
jgi:hypothetical protein